MPTTVSIKASSSVTPVTRRSVPAGAIFAILKRDGSLGEKRYASIGANGKMYSINIANGELASSANDDKRVAVVGSFTYDMNMVAEGEVRHCRRSEVREGEIFIVNGKSTLYGHAGRRTDGSYLSLNFATQNHAVTDNGNSNVAVVRTFKLNGKLVK